MPIEKTILPYDEHLPHLAAAMYLAVIFYPHNLKKRTDFVSACQSWWIKGESGRFPKNQVIVDRLLRFSESRKIWCEFNRANQILKKRMLADHAAMLYMMNSSIPVKIKGREFSIRRYLVELLHSKYNKSDPKQTIDNAYARVWKDSIPILHLLAGLRLSLAESQTKKEFDLIDLLQHPHWVKDAAEKAESNREFTKLFEAILPSKIQEAKMIQLVIE